MINLTIDGRKVSVKADTTILEAARSLGIHIPTLCEYKGLAPIGACRVCVVEVEGERKPVASCHVPTLEGMVVRTDTRRLWELRKMMVDLILATHPLECPICDKGGECDLQDITHAFDIKAPRYKLKNPNRTRAGANPFLYTDFQRCIQCIRCARYTEEVEGVKSFDYHGSGGYAFEMDRRLDRDPKAESVGGVVTVCPVGSLLNHPLKLHSIRPWNLTKIRTTCPHCPDGCQLLLNTFRGEIHRITAPSETDFSQGHPCLRGRFGYGFVGNPSRLTSPVVKKDGVRREVSWEEALSSAASRLKWIRERHGNEAVWGVPSHTLTNEEHAAFALFFSGIKGKVALSEGVGRTALAGVADVLGKRHSWPEPLIEGADLILVAGADLTGSNPFLANTVSRTARLKESRAVVINPRKVYLTRASWRWAAPKPGTEATLLTWIGKMAADSAWRTPDWLKGVDEKGLEAFTGVDTRLVEELSRAISKAERLCIIVGDDLSYHDNYYLGVSAANLLVFAGKADSQGSGVFPVLNESNSWGALNIHRDARDRSALYQAIKEGKVKALYIAGEDPASDWPSGWEDALRSLELLIVQDSNASKTVEMADVVFPSLTFAEADGTYLDTEGNIRDVKKGLEPLKDSRGGVEIIKGLAEGMGYPFKDLRLSLFLETAVSRGEDFKKPLESLPVPSIKASEFRGDHPLLLLTGKSLYGSRAVLESCQQLRDAEPEATLELHTEDARKLNLKDGERIRVSSEGGSVEVKASVKDTVLPGSVYLPLHPRNGSQKLTAQDGTPCFVNITSTI